VIPTSFLISLVSCTYDINGPADGPIFTKWQTSTASGSTGQVFH